MATQPFFQPQPHKLVIVLVVIQLKWIEIIQFFCEIVEEFKANKRETAPILPDGEISALTD